MSNIENNNTQLNKKKASIFIAIGVAVAIALIAIITTILLINRKSPKQFSKQDKAYIVQEVMLYNELNSKSISTPSKTENEQVSKELYAHTKTLEIYIFSQSFQATKVKNDSYEEFYKITMYGMKSKMQEYFIGYNYQDDKKIGVIYQNEMSELTFESYKVHDTLITTNNTKGYFVYTEDYSTFEIENSYGNVCKLAKEKNNYSFTTTSDKYTIIPNSGTLQVRRINSDSDSISCNINVQMVEEKYCYTYNFNGDTTTYKYEKY